MISAKQIDQLQILQDIYDISKACATKTYIWGGMVMDIMEGRFLREHRDIDCFTLNLLDVKEKFDILFYQKGYTTEFITGIDMYKITKGMYHAAFNRLETEKDTAMWRHIGNEGTLFFPENWLNRSPFSFYDSRAYVSGPEFEYSIKAKVSLLSPEWRLRETDKTALEYFRNVLEKHRISTTSVLEQVTSDNPYWEKRGYKQ